MFDPTEDKLDRDFDESMRMFAKALTDVGDPIEPRKPAKLLVALDGSSQDATVCAAADALRRRFDCQVTIVDARELGVADRATATNDAAIALEGAEVLEKTAGPSYEQILQATETVDPDLVVLPCPFGRDYESVGADSTGTVIDVMLSRCPVPMLIIRHPDQSVDKALNQIALIVAAECEAETLVANWAFGLIHPHGSISLEVVVDKEQLENLQQLLAMIAPERHLESDDLNQALADSHTALHAKMQRAALDAGVRYRLVPKANEMAPPVAGAEATQLLIALPLEVDDHFVQGFVHDRIRRSPHPVLVAPVHARKE